jgi:hypothetical protein
VGVSIYIVSPTQMVANDGAMPDNPNTAEPGKPLRRWVQFRLRTLP